MPFQLAELPESVKGYDKLALLLRYRSNSNKSRLHPQTMNHSFRNHIFSFPYFERFIPFRRKIYVHHTDVGCTIPRGVCTIALEGLLRALPSAKAVILKKSEKGSSGSCLDSCHSPKLLAFNLCILPVLLKGINITSFYLWV